MKEPPAQVVEKLLTVVPYLLSRSGLEEGPVRVPIQELVRDLNVSESELEFLASVLNLCELPPYGPTDTFDCTIESGWVSLWIARAPFKRPVRLSARQAEVLALGVRAVGVASPELAEAASRVLRKLEAVPAEGISPDASRILLLTEQAEEDEARLRQVLNQAMTDRQAVRLTYFSHFAGGIEEVLVAPVALLLAYGEWYLRAFVAGRDRVLTFRVDRIKDAVVSGPAGAMREVEKPLEHEESLTFSDTFPVEVELPATAARILEEGKPPFLSRVHYLPGRKRARLHMVTNSVAWLCRLVLGYGGAAQVVRPPQIRGEVARAAQAALAVYSRAQS